MNLCTATVSLTSHAFILKGATVEGFWNIYPVNLYFKTSIVAKHMAEQLALSVSPTRFFCGRWFANSLLGGDESFME